MTRPVKLLEPIPPGEILAEEYMRPHVLSQPESRGTAAGILLAAQWIETRDAGATLVCFPSDHLVLEEDAIEFAEFLLDFVR